MAAQVTLRIPLQQYGYLEVTGDTAEEVQELAESAYQRKLFETGIEIEAVAVAQSQLSGSRVVETRTPSVQAANPASAAAPEPAPAAAAPPAAAVGGGFTCEHGNRVHRTGQSAKGPWSAWFCPQPKGAPDACKPVWK